MPRRRLWTTHVARIGLGVNYQWGPRACVSRIWPGFWEPREQLVGGTRIVGRRPVAALVAASDAKCVAASYFALWPACEEGRTC